jgi:DNA-3-methyladenine glycosylase I
MRRILLPIGVLVLVIVVWLALPLVTNQTVDEPPPTLTDAELDALHAIEALTPEQVERMTTKKRDETNRTMEALAGFNPVKVAKFTEQDKKVLLQNAGIIRNKQKIEAAIQNARQFLEVQKEWGSFSAYMWSFVNNTPIQHDIRTLTDYPKTTSHAIAWSRDLKKRGFSFLGPIVCYAHMQAVGMMDDHMTCCFKYKKTKIKSPADSTRRA